jgi:hypothetical protein
MLGEFMFNAYKSLFVAIAMTALLFTGTYFLVDHLNHNNTSIRTPASK